MLQVARPVPATWRSGTIQTVASRVGLHDRAAAWYQRASNGPGILARLRVLGKSIVVRFHKSRAQSESNTPSALERLGEDLIALKLAGVPAHQMRSVVVELEHFIEDLDSAPVEETAVLVALEHAHGAECAENLAEAKMLCRADRVLTQGDIDAVIDAKKAKVAADQHWIAAASKLRRQLRASRAGLPTVTRAVR